MKDKIETLYLGTLNSELFWREDGYSELLSISDPQSDKVLSVLDELQFVFCSKPNDVLITRMPIDLFYKEYLTKIGFKFSCNNVIPKNGFHEKESGEFAVCELIAKCSNMSYFSKLASTTKSFSPYSILPESELLLKKLKIENDIPDINVVKKVNSKVFSSFLSKNLANLKKEEIVYSSNDLLKAGTEMLSSSQVLIKDPMGVSGKGNIQINSEKLLSRICKHIQKQEQKGKKTCFVLESMLNKKTDFSSQLLINKNGEIKFVTVQVMQNNGFAFSGIETSDSSFLSFLDKTEYFKQIEWIGDQIYKEGYFGPVCIDSMVNQQDEVIPIIEINARKSMGLINYSLDQYLTNFSVKGKLMYRSLILKNELPFEILHNRLSELGILFSIPNPYGILPLSANAINVNAIDNTKHSDSFKGRFYFSLVTEDKEKGNEILSKLNGVFNDLNVKVVN